MRMNRDIVMASRLFRSQWRQFLAIHLAASGLSLLVLTPLYTTLLGWLILASGDVALTDEDILYFVLSPTGLGIFWLAAALGVLFLVFEQAALFVTAWLAAAGHRIRLVPLGRHLLAHSWAIFRLGLRLMLRVALLAAPFLALAAALYQTWLTEFDINYYLTARPPELWLVGGAIALTLALMAAVLLRELAGWVAALPLLLLGQGGPREVLRRSRRRAAPGLLHMVRWLAVWVSLYAALLGALGWLLELGAGGLATLGQLSLEALWSLGNLAVSFLGNCMLSLGLFAWFRRLFPELEDSPHLSAALDSRPGARGLRWRAYGLVMAVLALSAAAGGFIHIAIERQAGGESVQIVAHRGASGEAPENTPGAMELAVEQGADWVEIDVQETRDGEVVVIHDSDLMKVGGVPLRVGGATLHELKQVDVGSWHGEPFAGQRIPSLREALLQLRGRAGVIIELKVYGGERALEERTVAIVEETGMEDSVMIMSLSGPAVRKMKSLRPAWRVGLLSAVAVGDMTRMEADFLAVSARLARRPFIRRAQRRGKDVYAWTVNDPVSMSALMGRDVAGIITDYPALALRVRAERSRMGLHELFILQVASALGSQMDLPQ
jgi:glycerophosphoryl diester phosphodiesterase